MRGAEAFSRKPKFEQEQSEDDTRIDIANILRNGDSGVQFVVEQWHSDSPSPGVRENGFEELPESVRLRTLRHLVEACRMYYTGYIVDDPFGNDEATRLKWQTQMLKEYGERFHEFQRRIKLRLGPITGVLGMFRSFVDELNKYDIHTKEAEQARALFARLPTVATFISTPEDPLTYEKMSYEQKLELVRKIDSATGGFLSLVTKPAP